MADCPPAESFERLLGENLNEEERKRIEAHVENCAACQKTLHNLALNVPGPAPARLLSALSEAPVSEADEADTFIRQLKMSVLSTDSDGGQRSPSEPSESVELPKVAGYEVQAELGRGAVGVVYRARDVELNRLVALKMVLAGAHLSPGAKAVPGRGTSNRPPSAPKHRSGLRGRRACGLPLPISRAGRWQEFGRLARRDGSQPRRQRGSWLRWPKPSPMRIGRG